MCTTICFMKQSVLLLFYMEVTNSLNLKSDSSLRYSIHLFKNPPSKRGTGFDPPLVPNKVSESQMTHKCRLALVIATKM